MLKSVHGFKIKLNTSVLALYLGEHATFQMLILKNRLQFQEIIIIFGKKWLKMHKLGIVINPFTLLCTENTY